VNIAKEKIMTKLQRMPFSFDHYHQQNRTNHSGLFRFHRHWSILLLFSRPKFRLPFGVYLYTAFRIRCIFHF